MYKPERGMESTGAYINWVLERNKEIAIEMEKNRFNKTGVVFKDHRAPNFFVPKIVKKKPKVVEVVVDEEEEN